MTKRIRLLVASLTIAAAATTGTTLTPDQARVPGDTTWGAPDATGDTTWGNPPAGDNEDDTTWG